MGIDRRPGDPTDPASEGFAASNLSNELTADAGVPVQASFTDGDTNIARQDDSSPYYGGGRVVVRHADGTANECTSGFGYQNASYEYLLTSAHCFDATGEELYNGNRERLIGTARYLGWNHHVDVALVRTNASRRVFHGHWKTWESRLLMGSVKPAVGMSVCAGGSVSGTICNVRVKTVGGRHRANNDPTWSYASIVAQTDGVAFATRGDSGAPLYRLIRASNWQHLEAVGMMKAIHPNYERPCQGEPSNPNPCFYLGWMVPMDRVVQGYYNLSPITEPDY